MLYLNNRRSSVDGHFYSHTIRTCRRRPILGWTVAFLLVEKEVFTLMKKNNRAKNKTGNYSSNEKLVEQGVRNNNVEKLIVLRRDIVDLKIHSDFSKVNLDEMKDIYASVGWTKHTEEIIKQVFEASNVIALVTVNGRIIGIGRAMTDGVFNAAIYDVVVHRDFQRQGIAKKIMEFLLDKLSNISCVHLISTTSNEGFYRERGFKKLKTGMARYLNPGLSDEYLE